MNAILRYPGGKWRIADWIVGHFPAHRVYCEPFFGSGAVFFRKSRSRLETINDLDGDVVNLFRVIRERPLELAALLELTPYAREEYDNAAAPAADPVERARRTVVRHWLSFGGRTVDSSGFRVSQAPSAPPCTAQWRQLPGIVRELAGRIADAQIENCDALDLIDRYDDPDTLIYCDPPYLPGIRKGGLYDCEMNNETHLKLLRKLKASRAMVCLSGYDSELYNDELGGWRTAARRTTATSGARRIEKLYMNYQPPQLFFAD